MAGRMEATLIEVEMLKMIDPGCYLIKEKSLTRSSVEFNEMCEQMNLYFNSEGFAMQTIAPVLGMNYIGKERDKWYRVRVDQVVQRTIGPHASCYLLDYGKECVMIPLRWLRQAKAEFFQVPFQVKQSLLYNIQPITLVMDVDLNNSWGPASKWDESSSSYMKDVFLRAKLWKASFVLEKEDAWEIELYALDNQSMIHINDLLVRKKFAEFKDCDLLKRASYSSTLSPENWTVSKATGSNDTNTAASVLPSSNRLRPISRGTLLKSLLNNALTPPVGRRSSGDTSPASDSDHSQKLEKLHTFGSLGMAPACNGDARFSNSDREIHESSGGGKVSLDESPPGLLTGSGVESRQQKIDRASKSGTFAESRKPSAGRVVESRLPKHLRKEASCAVSSSGLLNFVVPNTNLAVASNNRQLDPSLPHSDLDSTCNRPGATEVMESCQNSSFKPSPVPSLDHEAVISRPDCREIDTRCIANKLESSQLTFPIASSKNVSRQPTAEDLEILVDGNKFVKCVTDLNGQPFLDLVRQTPGLMSMDRPTNLQSFIWPAVMRGFDVVGISVSRYKSGSPGGKTLSYLLPIISLLNFLSTYKDLPKHSISPYVLILCPTWNQALKIYDQCQNILRYQQKLRLHQIKLRVNLLFGGGGDENQEVTMINGCEILVSTPHSFLRMLDKKLTNLSRVCHLVLEEADILAEQFTPEMDRIMNQYKLELKERQGGSVPQQVLIFGSRWNSALMKFSYEYQVSPVVVVSTKMEAAYYGGVKQRPLMCLDQQRLNRVVSLLETRTQNVLVFTSNSEQAKSLHETINAASIYALLACDEMNCSDFELVKREWLMQHRADSLPVLVLTDSNLSALNISDAGWIIHFDVPSQLEVFADRLWCMRQYYESYGGEKLIEADECVSFILISETCENLSSRLIQVLQRCESNVPSSLSAMSEKHMERKEKGKQSQLCHSLKSFGFCRNQVVCPYRHKVFSSLDQPGISSRHIKLPTDGTIRVLVKHVVDASCLYVNLIQHSDLDGHLTSLRTDYANLGMDMAHYFVRPNSRHPAEKAEEGKLYAIEDLQHVFHRVEVLGVFSSATANDPDEAEVFQVDIGGILTVKIAEMYELPSQMAEVPYQAVEVFICRIKPFDNDFTWTRKAQMYLAEKIQDIALDGNIVLSLGNSLWLDPVQKRTWLPEFQFWQHNFTVRLLLLEAKFAEENPKHIELLYKACDGIVQLPSGLSTSLSTTHAYTFDGCLIQTKTEEFSEGDCKYHDIYLTAVKSPDLLYVQLASNENRLNQLNEEIRTFMILADDKASFEPKKGLLVLAKDSCRGWCRGRIQDMSDGNSIEVFYVDCGITDNLSLTDIIPMPLRFKQLPFQAIECSLIGIEPMQAAYLDKCADFILGLTEDQQGDPIKLQALVVRKTEARYTGRHHYGINLHDISSTCYHVNISSQLVVNKFAKLSSDKLKVLFPFAYGDCTADQSYKAQFSIICRDLLKNENKEMVNGLTGELERLTEEVITRDSSLCGLVSIVGQVLEYSWEAETAHAIILSLKLLIKNNPNHCTELLDRDILDVLCHVFAKHELNGLQEEMLLLFSPILSCARCCGMFIRCGGLWYLGNDLSRSHVEFIIQAESQLVLAALKNTRESGLTIGHLKCLEAAIKHLDQSNPCIIRHSLDIIEHLLSCYSKYKDEVWKHHGIKVICSQLESWSEKKILCQALKILTMLTVDNRFNKDEVAQNLPSSLHDEFRADADVQNLYDDLKNRIHHSLSLVQRNSVEQIVTSPHNSTRSKKVINHQTIDNQPIPKELLEVVSDRRRPNIKWTQSLWDILLTVDVKDAKKLQDVATFTNDSITFRAVAMSTEFSFHFTLYELIVPEKCETSITAGFVYVGLKKKSHGIWPRLLRDKLLKCPFLSVDFNQFKNILESLSDDEMEDDDQFQSPLALMYHKSGYVPVSFSECYLPSSPYEYENATPDLWMTKNRASLSDDGSNNLDSDEDSDSKFDPRFTEDTQFEYHIF